MERRVTRAAAKAKSLDTLEQVLGEYRHEAVFRCFSVVELWRLRRVCHARSTGGGRRRWRRCRGSRRWAGRKWAAA